MDSEKMKQQLRRDEGLRKFPYRDSVGKLTIGIGRNLEDKGLAEKECFRLLQNDVEDVELAVAGNLPWARELNDARQGVLVNMAFNMGIDGLLQFDKMLDAMREGDWSRAAEEMENSHWWDQVGIRAERLQQQMLTGEWH